MSNTNNTDETQGVDEVTIDDISTNQVLRHCIALGSLRVPGGRRLKYLNVHYGNDGDAKVDAIEAAKYKRFLGSLMADANGNLDLSSGRVWESGTAMVASKSTQLGALVSACMKEHRKDWMKDLEGGRTSKTDLLDSISLGDPDEENGGFKFNYTFMLKYCGWVKGQNDYNCVRERFLAKMDVALNQGENEFAEVVLDAVA